MCKCLGDSEEPSPSMGDVIVLVTGDAFLGMASDKETGLTIFFMSSIRLVVSLINLSWLAGQRDIQADRVPLLTWKTQLGTCFGSLPHQISAIGHISLKYVSIP